MTLVRHGGLLVPFDVPELTIGDAIERGWELSWVLQLMVPKPSDEYLPTYPVDRPWAFAPDRIPWRDNWCYTMERLEPAHGPFITGLPEL